MTKAPEYSQGAALTVPAEPAALDVDTVLADYHRRQRIEHMIGPAVSLVFHVVLVTLVVAFAKPGVQTEVIEVEVKVEEMKVKELEPQRLQEVRRPEPIVEEVVPTVERPDVPQDNVEFSSTASAGNGTGTGTGTGTGSGSGSGSGDIGEGISQNDSAMDFSGVLDVRTSSTALKIPGLYGGRTAGGRKQMIVKFGGSTRTEGGVVKALRWLKQTQKADGSWSQTQADAMAGLGLLTFLAHGETPLSEEFGPTVQKAMQYLADRMMAVDATQTKYLGRCYVNGICTYALSEAYGLTKIPFLKPPMEKGLGFIVEGQQKGGGFDYNYAKGARWDTSVTGWQLQALKAGYVAGADVPGLMGAMEKGISFLKNTSYSDGHFGYSKPGEGTMGVQGAGTLCLQLLGEGECQEVRKALDYIHVTEKVAWDDTAEYASHTTPVYDWYYITQAMFHAGRSKWNDWNKLFTETVVNHQKPDGHWDSPGKAKWMQKGESSGKMDEVTRPEYDPWYATTLCCLSLQVYYRYLPTYKMPKSMAKQEKSVLEAVDKDLGIDLN